jgi:hypothetical protein
MPSIDVYLKAITTSGWLYKLEYDGSLHKLSIWKPYRSRYDWANPVHWEHEDINKVVKDAFKYSI